MEEFRQCQIGQGTERRFVWLPIKMCRIGITVSFPPGLVADGRWKRHPGLVADGRWEVKMVSGDASKLFVRGDRKDEAMDFGAATDVLFFCIDGTA